MILIVGGGLAAFSLGKILFEKGISFQIIKNENPAASLISSGIINPISGRNFVLSWKYHEFLNTAKSFYKIEKQSFINSIMIEKYVEDPISYSNLLLSIESNFQNNQCIIYENFDYKLVNTATQFYKDISYQAIIFAEGIGVLNNPFFNHLPFAPNRGEAIEVSSMEFDLKNVVHKGKFICPYKNHYWIGSSFDRVSIDEPLHTEKAKEELISKGNFFFGDTQFDVLNHLAAFRSTTHDRRPFIDRHLTIPNLFIFNGFGTKGVSLIPYYGIELIQNILDKTPISEEVQILRIKKDKKYHLI